MFLLPSLLPILACLSGSFGEEDLQKKVFVFPTANKKAGVQVNVSLQHPLTNFTVCVRFNPLHTRAYTLFYYSTKPNARDFQIAKVHSSQFILQIGGMIQIIALPKMLHSEWQHICMAWTSITGMAYCWYNGQLLPRFMMRKGYKISEKGIIFLGHDRESWGKRECFLGEMADFNVWPRVLESHEIDMVTKNDDVPNSVVSWRALSYKPWGGVLVEEALHQVS